MTTKKYAQLSRREFLRFGLTSLGAVALSPVMWDANQLQWAQAKQLGRVVAGKISLWSRPTTHSKELGPLYQDAVVEWLREVVGEAPGLSLSRTWVETPNGYLYAPRVQPVFNQPHPPVDSLPETALGRGMWVEVCVPYVDLTWANPRAVSEGSWMHNNDRPRFYYSQVFWVDDLRTNASGHTEYRLVEQYAHDIFWGRAEAFRPMTPKEVEPINPHHEDKLVLINLNHQTLSCYEGRHEVYFCRISSGGKYDIDGNPTDKWSTPITISPVWRKLISHHMTGGETGGGWDIPGIAWTVLFSGSGVAIHSTFWHNDYGTPRSRGCINARPDDAKWVFRWTDPVVTYDMGEKTVQMPGGTRVQVVE
jgi:hypothetical protein